MDELTRLSAGQYLSLTTFRRSGEPVATPVWVARSGDHLYVITQDNSGKVKRLRHTSDVLVAPCDMRGTITGSQVPASAELLDPEGTQAVRQLINRKYGLMARLLEWGGAVQSAIRRRPRADSIGIEISLSPAGHDN